MNHFDYQGWQVTSLKEEGETRTVMERVFDPSDRTVLKNDHNSHVYRIPYSPTDLVAKYPTARNRRLWERWCTLFRTGKAMRAWQGMYKLQQLGFDVPTPILTATKRKWGMIIDSFLVYEFVDGEPVSNKDEKLIDQILMRLHKAGYLRHDASAHNYLTLKDRVVMIDTTLRQPHAFKQAQFLMEHLGYHKHHPDKWFALYKDIIPERTLRFVAGYFYTRSKIRRCWKKAKGCLRDRK